MTFPYVVDNSQRSAFIRCPEYWRQSYIEHRRLKGGSVHLNAGGALAEGLQHARTWFYTHGVSEDDAIAHGFRELTLAYGPSDPPESLSHKSYSRMVEAYWAYFDKYPMATDIIKPLAMPNGVHGIEFSFAIPIPEVQNPSTGDPIIYGGRFDMLGDMNGTVLAVDEKTTRSLTAAWAAQWSLDSQITGYVWAAQQYGHNCVGGVIRGIGLLKYETRFVQVPVYRSKWEIERWYAQLVRDLQRMVEAYHHSKYDKALDKFTCHPYNGACAYAKLCESRTPETWYDDYEIREWNPLVKSAGLASKSTGSNALLTPPLNPSGTVTGRFSTSPSFALSAESSGLGEPSPESITSPYSV